MPTRRLDDIIPPSRRREAEQSSAMPPAGRSAPPQSAPRPGRFPYTTLTVVAGIVILSILALFYFSTAKVVVTPNSVSTSVQSAFTADQSSSTLPFALVSTQKIASQSVQGSGTKTVNESASGTLTIYNTQSKSQRLIANTRFASPAGLIFRIHNAVTVPAGSSGKPGSVTAKAYADQAGDTYNISPASFTVPGLAGTPQASEVYARSFSPMTGGASGTIPVIGSAVEAQAVQALTDALAPELAASIQSQVPAGYVLIPGAATTTYEETTPSPSSTTGMVDVKVQGTITAVVFPNAALASAIASSVSGLGYQGEPLSIATTTDLSLAASSLPAADQKTFAFALSGTPTLVYTVDPTRIAAAVAGKTRSLAEVALTNYPEVKRAILILRPFWKTSFPQDPASISVSVGNP